MKIQQFQNKYTQVEIKLTSRSCVHLLFSANISFSYNKIGIFFTLYVFKGSSRVIKGENNVFTINVTRVVSKIDTK